MNAKDNVKPIKSSVYGRRTLTVPVLKMEDERVFRVKILDAFRESKAQNLADGKRQMDPATVCTVENLEDNKRYTLILNKVLHGVIVEAFPDNTYIGVSLEFVRHAKSKGKRYHTFSVDVLE